MYFSANSCILNDHDSTLGITSPIIKVLKHTEISLSGRKIFVVLPTCQSTSVTLHLLFRWPCQKAKVCDSLPSTFFSCSTFNRKLLSRQVPLLSRGPQSENVFFKSRLSLIWCHKRSWITLRRSWNGDRSKNQMSLF